RSGRTSTSAASTTPCLDRVRCLWRSWNGTWTGSSTRRGRESPVADLVIVIPRSVAMRDLWLSEGEILRFAQDDRKENRSGPDLADSPDVFSPRVCRLTLLGVVFLALAIAGSRCATVFEKPELRFRGLRLNSIGLGGAAVDVVVDVYNPNSFELGVD